MGAPIPTGIPHSRGVPGLAGVAGQVGSALRVAAVLVWAVLRWTCRHLRGAVSVAGLAVAVRLLPDGQPNAIWLLVLGWVVPAVVAVVWALLVAGFIRAVGCRASQACVMASLGPPSLADPGPGVRPVGPA